MKIIGLTGSIGMGKTTTAKMFEAHDVPINGADDIVHALYENEAVPFIKERFPEAVLSGKVDRDALSKALIHNPQGFKDLEAIIHPLVRQKQDEFIACHKINNADLVLLDIPLLFETDAQSRVDIIVVVTCSPEIQRKRILARKNMTEEKFEFILKKQLPDHEKRKRADHIVDTSENLVKTEEQVIAIINALRHD